MLGGRRVRNHGHEVFALSHTVDSGEVQAPSDKAHQLTPHVSGTLIHQRVARHII